MTNNSCPIYFDSVVKINNQTELSHSLNVSGSTTLADTVANTLNVTGATTLASTLDVEDVTTLASALNVTGATTLASTLDVEGVTTLANALNLTMYSPMENTLFVEGITTLGNVLNVSGIAVLKNTLHVSGATTIHDELSVVNNTNLHSVLNVSGATVLKNTLNVSGAATLANTTASSLSVNGTADTIINNFTIKNDGELDPGANGLSINNIDNIGTSDGYKTLVYDNINKHIKWTNENTSDSSQSLNINVDTPILTTVNTGQYYIKTIDTAQQLRLRIKTGTTTYQDLLIGTYDTIDPVIVLPEGDNVFKNIHSIFNDTIDVTEAGITETITFGTTNSYNTNISTSFGTIRAELTLDGVITNSIDMSNTNIYIIKYIATDNAGNIKEIERTLNIIINPNFYNYYYKINTNSNFNYNTSNVNKVGYAVRINSLGNYIAYSKSQNNKIIIKKEIDNVWSIYCNHITVANAEIITNIQFDNTGNKLVFNYAPQTGNSGVCIYTNDGDKFNHLQTIPLSYAIGQTINNHNSLSISGDGNIILVAEDVGYIRVYKLDQTRTIDPYVKLQRIGYGVDDFGFSTSIDNLGNKLIIGSPANDADNGKVCLYNFSNNNYIPTPTEFTVSTPELELTSGYNKIGYDVSISDTGRFAFSAPFANENSKTYSGCVFIYENNNTLLTKINGYDDYMGFGTKIELSKNGKVITITARDSNSSNITLGEGFVKMYYEYQEKTVITDSVWLEIDHKNLYSDTSDIDIRFGFSTALNYSGNKLLIGSPEYDINTINSVGNINLYYYESYDAKIYNSWDLYLKDKTTAESGLNINDLTNIEVYLTLNKNNPLDRNITYSNPDQYIYNNKNSSGVNTSEVPVTDYFTGSYTNVWDAGLIGKFDNTNADNLNLYKYVISSPNFKEYLSGSVNGDISIHAPTNPDNNGASVIKIPIAESGYYVIYNLFLWIYGIDTVNNLNNTMGLNLYTYKNSTLTQKINTIYDNYFNNYIANNDLNPNPDIKNTYKNFIKYYSGGKNGDTYNGSVINVDTNNINGVELGYLESGDHIYFAITNEGNSLWDMCTLRFQIAKRPTAIPIDYKHIVTIHKNQPVCNPWNGTAIDELAPTVYNPLVTYSKYKGRDLEIKLDVTLEDGTTETFQFAGWRLDEVFNFYLKNGVNTLGKVFAKSSLSNNTWFTADNVSSYKFNDGGWQWSFTDEDHNSVTTDTGLGHRVDTGIENVGVLIGSDGAVENIKYLWSRNHGGLIIKSINVSMKKAGIMAVPNGGFNTTITEGDTYNDLSITLYEWVDTNGGEYQTITVPSSDITSSFSPTFDTNTSGTYIQTYTITYNGETYTTTRTVIISTPYGNSSWIQQGVEKSGGFDNAQYGKSVAISGDGTVMAFGAYENTDGTFTTAGSVHIYKYDNGTWVNYGYNNNKIIGYTTDEYSGQSIALNYDGTKIVVGAPGFDGQKGAVRVFGINSDGSGWSGIFDLVGVNPGDITARSVAINSTGNIIAFSTPNYDTDSNNPNSGKISVYTQDTGWTQLGTNNAMIGEPGILAGTHMQFGYNQISLSNDGYTIAASSRNWGIVKIYKYISGDWQQIGNNIDEDNNNNAGEGVSISLNGDGTRIAVGAYQAHDNTNNYNEAGAVRVYDYNGIDNWVKIGNTIYGDSSSFRLGRQVSLTDDGTILAIGSSGDSTGCVKTYYYSETGYINFGNTITLDGTNNGMGENVSINSDGTKLIIGANRYNSNSGIVKVYNLSEN